MADSTTRKKKKNVSIKPDSTEKKEKPDFTKKKKEEPDSTIKEEPDSTEKEEPDSTEKEEPDSTEKEEPDSTEKEEPDSTKKEKLDSTIKEEEPDSTKKEEPDCTENVGDYNSKRTQEKLKTTEKKLEITEKKLEITEKKLEITKEELETNKSKLETAEKKLKTAQSKLEEALKINARLPSIHDNPPQNQPRVGCAALSFDDSNPEKPAIRVNVSNYRDSVEQQITLKESLKNLSKNCKRDQHYPRMFTLIGGIDVLDVRSHVENVFGRFENDNRYQSCFPCRNEQRARNAVKQNLTRAFQTGFTLGIEHDGDDDRILFINDAKLSSQPREDKEYCESLADLKDKVRK